jgi:hypothetical protein
VSRLFYLLKGQTTHRFPSQIPATTVVAGKSGLWVFNPINLLSTQLKPKKPKTKS